MRRKLLVILSALLIAASLSACNNEGEKITEDTSANITAENTEKESTTEEEETNEDGSQVTPPAEVDSKNPGEYTYDEVNDKIYVLAPSGALNLRTADYVIKTSVKTGTELQRTGVSTDGVWSRVSYNDETLYVNNKYTTKLADLDAGFTAVEKTLVSVGSLKIHIAPEEDFDWQIEVKIIGWFTEGDEVKVVAVNEETGYYKVEFTPYGSDTTTFGYVTSNEKYFEDEVVDSGDTASGKFTVENMTVTLTKDFASQDISGYTAVFIDEENVVSVFVLQEKFSSLEGFEDWSLEQYATALKSNISASDVSETKVEDGITYFDYEFTNTDLDVKYYYYTTVFKDTDSFWFVQFACLAEDSEELKPVFANYAKSVTFAE